MKIFSHYKILKLEIVHRQWKFQCHNYKVPQVVYSGSLNSKQGIAQESGIRLKEIMCMGRFRRAKFGYTPI